MTSLAQIVFAYWLADLLTGIYHYATDKGFNIRQQCELFADHHLTNRLETWDWQPSVPAVPAFLCTIAVWFTGNPHWLQGYLPFLFAISIFGMAAQVPHYYAHNPGRANIIIRGLQATGIFISPNHHGAHHTGLYDRNFCIVSNWNNWWFNWLVGAK